MRPHPSLVLTSALLACPGRPTEGDATGVQESERQVVVETPPEARPDPSHEATSLAPEPEPAAENLELDEPKAALANVGRAAFDALRAGDFVALRKLTPLDEGPVRKACPDLPRLDATELEAKFGYCHRTIDWEAVAEAQVFAPKPTGEPAPGCEMGIEDYGRLQLYLHMNDETIWQVDFFGAIGADGKALGVDGSVACKRVDEAPPL